VSSPNSSPASVRPSRRRRLWPLLAFLVLVVLVIGAFFAYQALQVRSDLRAAESDARALQDALAGGDGSAAQAQLESLQDNSDSAYDTTQGFLWSVAAKAPLVGDDVDAVRSVTGALRDISASALPPLVNAAQNLNAASFTPKDGRIAIEPLRQLAPAVAEASPVLDANATRLDGIQASSLVGQLREPVTDVRDKLNEAANLISSADTALQVLPSMLGGEGKRDYLLMFQNNSEIRSTGGLPGAYAVLSVDDGKISLGRQGGGSQISFDSPVVPLTDEERAIYDVQLGTFFVDTNFTPDFPRTAEIAREMWRRESGQQVDGVISLDPVALSYILEGTGPVTLADGSELTSENVVDRLLNQVYFDIESPPAQDAYFARAAKSIFDAVSAGQGDPKGILSGIAEAAGEHRVLVTSFDEAEQRVLSPTQVAGALPTGDGATPHVGVYLNDATGAKMQYYLDYDVEMSSASCSASGQELSGKLTLTSRAPKDVKSLPDYVANESFGTEAGSQLLFLRLYAPTGGSVEAIRYDGKKVNFGKFTHEGRPVARALLLLEPGQTLEVDYDMTTGPEQTGAVEVDVTPGLQRGDKSSQAPSSC
jgi:hypothetical protein